MSGESELSDESNCEMMAMRSSISLAPAHANFMRPSVQTMATHTSEMTNVSSQPMYASPMSAYRHGEPRHRTQQPRRDRS